MDFREWWAQYLDEGGKTHFNICANEESARLAWNAATLEEREACAKLCDGIEYDYYRDNKCATAIRLRYNVKLRGDASRQSLLTDGLGGFFNGE